MSEVSNAKWTKQSWAASSNLQMNSTNLFEEISLVAELLYQIEFYENFAADLVELQLTVFKMEQRNQISFNGNWHIF